WTGGDFSFVEPTALAMLFLKRTGHAGEPRLAQAAAMLRARAFAAGGWNYGEPEVLGGMLFPTVAPTALAALALADEADDQTSAALDWLETQRGQISSLYSLAWAALALNLGGRPATAWQQDIAGKWPSTPAQ